MEISAKDRLLADIFYNPQTGFRGVEQTYTAARLRDATVNRGDVRAFLAKQELRQRRKPHKVNSYVASFPRQEFQVDLLDMGDSAVPRYGFVCIDIFTKKGACIPINRKLAPVTADALKRVFDELGYPTSICVTREGTFEENSLRYARMKM